ncbi:MAG: hypothetical protein ACI33S_04180 [Bacilli bacterium]
MENMYEYYKFMNDIYFRKEIDKDYFEVLNKDGVFAEETFFVDAFYDTGYSIEPVSFDEVSEEMNKLKGSAISR